MGVTTQNVARVTCGTDYSIEFQCDVTAVMARIVDDSRSNEVAFCGMTPSECRKLAKALERLADDAESE